MLDREERFQTFERVGLADAEVQTIERVDLADADVQTGLRSDLSSPQTVAMSDITFPAFSVAIIFDYASVQDILHLCAAGHMTHQCNELASHLIGMFQMARQNSYRFLRSLPHVSSFGNDFLKRYPREYAFVPEILQQADNEAHQALHSKQRDSIKCLVEHVVKWRRYMPRRIMGLVQCVGSDLLKPELRLVSARLCEGFASWGDRHVKNCIAKKVLMLMKVPAYHALALDVLRECQYDMGRFQNETVDELLQGTLRQRISDLWMLTSVLKFTPSPGKSHPLSLGQFEQVSIRP